MKKIIGIFCVVFAVLISGQQADASVDLDIDFMITEEINMQTSKGSTDMNVDPLFIENYSNKYDIRVEKINFETEDGWTLVEKTADFSKMAKDAKCISLSTVNGEDLFTNNVKLGDIQTGQKSEFKFNGKVSKMTQEGTTKVGNFIVEIVPVLDARTVIYEDGTFIINELLKDGESNEAIHGAVVKEYPALGFGSEYQFSSYTQVMWADDRSLIKRVYIGSNIKPKKTAYWFYNCTNIEYFDSTNLDVSDVTDMSGMFNRMGASVKDVFRIIGLETWDVSKVRNISSMFTYTGYSAVDWSIGDISGWDTSSVVNMNNTFFSCGNKASNWYVGDLGKWDVSNVTNFGGTFRQTGESSTYIDIGDISTWDVSKGRNMEYMFYNMGSKAKDVDIGQLDWDISNAGSTDVMFYQIGKSDPHINLGTLTIGNETTYNSFMSYCANMDVSIKVKDYIDKSNSIFHSAARNEGTQIKLIPLSEDANTWCQEIIAKYGPNGTSTKGNITI